MLDVVPVVAKVIRVPRQRFVAALPVQYHLDTVLRRRPHQLVAHQRSKRVYGLVLKPEHLLKIGPQLFRAGLELNEPRPGLRDRRANVSGLVKLGTDVAKAGKRSARIRLLTDPCRCARDRRRIEAARKMNAHRHVAAHVHADRVFEELRKALARIASQARDGVANVPVAVLAKTRSFEGILESATRRELADAAIEGFVGLVKAAIDQERTGDCFVELVSVITGGPYRLDLGREDKTPGLVAIVEGLDAEAISRSKELVVPAVVDDKSPHPVEALEAGRTPFEIAVQKHLAVARRAEDMAARLQLMLELDEVVDLSVEDDGERPIGGAHRLMARRREIQNRKSPEPEADPAREIAALVVRTTMPQD